MVRYCYINSIIMKKFLLIVLLGSFASILFAQNEKAEAEIKQLTAKVEKFQKEVDAATAKGKDEKEIRVLKVHLDEAQKELNDKSKALNDMIKNSEFMSNFKENDGFKYIRTLEDKKISFDLIDGKIVQFKGNVIWTGISKYDANKIMHDDASTKTCYTPTDNPSIGDFGLCDTTLRVYAEDETNKRKYFQISCTSIEYDKNKETEYCAVRYSDCKLVFKLPIITKKNKKYYVIYLGKKLKKTDIINTNDNLSIEGELYYKHVDGTNLTYFYLDKWIIVKTK
jgi:hypothetical protein